MNKKTYLDKIQAEARGQKVTETDVRNILGEADFNTLMLGVGTIATVLSYVNSRPRRCKSKRSHFNSSRCGAEIVAVETENGLLIEICEKGHKIKIPLIRGSVARKLRRKY